MKVVIWSLFMTSVCLSLVEEASSTSATIVGDILIERQNDGLLYCDSMICPKETANCHVTKRNDPDDLNIINRQRSCISKDGTILKEEKVNERNKVLGTVNVNVMSGGGITNLGRPMTPEEQKELDEYLKKTEENVKLQVGGALNQVQSSLGPLLDGSFASNLQSQIAGSLQNIFNW